MRKIIPAALLVSLNLVTACAQQPVIEPQQQRLQQINTIEQISNEMLPNPVWLESPQWHAFLADLRSDEMLAMPLETFVRSFKQRADKLPFTHFRLVPRKPMAASSGTADSSDLAAESTLGLRFTQPAKGIGLLQVAHFEFEPESFSALSAEMDQADLAALIIDLRGNEGGSFPSVMALSRYLRSEPLDAGYFLTRRWFMQHDDYPDQAQRQAIPKLETLNLAAFAEMLQREGALRLELPAHSDPVFTGKLAILTDGATASAAEPFVYMMQQHGIPIVGETTDGAMLSGDRVPVDDDLVLFLPLADYLTPDGKRLDLVGVQPDVAVPADQALTAALELLAED